MKKKAQAPVLSILGTLTDGGLKTIDDNQINHYPQSNKDEITTTSTEKEDNLNLISKMRSKHIEQLITVSPEACIPWKYADRSEEEMGDLHELADSIKKNGQQEPILVRPATVDQENIKYEIIFGNRRWQACKLVGTSIKAILRHMDDREAAVCQKEENANRENLSDYSRAFSYKRLLDSKIFENATQLASMMNISKQTMADIMSYTRIHPNLLKVIPESYKMPRRSAVRLATLTSKCSEQELINLVSNAKNINISKLPSNKIEELLLNQPKKQINKDSESCITKNSLGENLFTIKKRSSNVISIVLHKVIGKNLSIKEVEAKIKEMFGDVLSE